MTKKRCTDCKHTKGIGYDFWCGEGHTEYEVFGAETNCPYFEYHDWSKGTPSRTKKRFTHRKWYNERQLFDGEEPFAIVDIYIQSDKICNKLNELADENEELKQQREKLFIRERDTKNEWREIRKENEQLKIGINSLKLLVQNWEALDEEKDEQLDKQNQKLKKLVKENAQLKQLINDKEVEWLRNNTVWEQMPTSKRTVTKTTFGDEND